MDLFTKSRETGESHGQLESPTNTKKTRMATLFRNVGYWDILKREKKL
jgi:hypothetical protein